MTQSERLQQVENLLSQTMADLRDLQLLHNELVLRFGVTEDHVLGLQRKYDSLSPMDLSMFAEGPEAPNPPQPPTDDGGRVIAPQP